MKWRFGLGSWSNRHFEHGLYPLRTLHAKRPELYAQLFDCVELNILHHQEVAAQSLHEWAASVPKQFRFLPKMHKDVTHGGYGDGELHGAAKFLARLAPLGDKVGPILLQFPKTWQYTDDHVGWLQGLLEIIADAGAQAAVEFRHPSWFVPAIESLLASKAATLVWSPYPKAFAPPWTTTSTGYVRLVGTAGKQRGRWVTSRDRLEDLLELRQRLQSNPFRDCYVVVTNRFEGNALDTLPKAAAAFAGPELGRKFTPTPGQPLLGGQ